MTDTTTGRGYFRGGEDRAGRRPAGRCGRRAGRAAGGPGPGGGLQLTGEGGLLQQLTKRVLEAALDGEITDHLGYDKHDPAGNNGGNSRNGARAKTVLTEVGPVEIDVPRDREGSRSSRRS